MVSRDLFDTEAFRRDIAWRDSIRTVPQSMQYFREGHMRPDDRQGTTEYFNYHNLALADAKQLLGTLEVKVTHAFERGGANGNTWENGLDEREGELLAYLRFFGFLTNYGVSEYLKSAQKSLLDVSSD